MSNKFQLILMLKIKNKQQVDLVQYLQSLEINYLHQ